MNIMYFPEAVEKPAVTVAMSNIVKYLAQTIGSTLKAFLRWFPMSNLPRINNPNPMQFLNKFIKNNKEDQGNNTKLCMCPHKLPMNIPSEKNKMFNFSKVSNKSKVKKGTLFSMFTAVGPLIVLRSP